MALKNLSKQIILADAAYLAEVAENILSFFANELMGRTDLTADLCTWVERCAEDAGWRPLGVEGGVDVIFVRKKEQERLSRFFPSLLSGQADENLSQEDPSLNGLAFLSKSWGEITFYVVDDEHVMGEKSLIVQCMEEIIRDKEKHSLVVVANKGEYAKDFANAMEEVEDKPVTFITMHQQDEADQPLGFSILSAFGIKSGELERNI